MDFLLSNLKMESSKGQPRESIDQAIVLAGRSQNNDENSNQANRDELSANAPSVLPTSNQVGLDPDQLAKENGATVIQSNFRGFLIRSNMNMIRRSAQKIQASWKGYNIRKGKNELFGKLRNERAEREKEREKKQILPADSKNQNTAGNKKKGGGPESKDTVVKGNKNSSDESKDARGALGRKSVSVKDKKSLSRAESKDVVGGTPGSKSANDKSKKSDSGTENKYASGIPGSKDGTGDKGVAIGIRQGRGSTLYTQAFNVEVQVGHSADSLLAAPTEFGDGDDDYVRKMRERMKKILRDLQDALRVASHAHNHERINRDRVEDLVTFMEENPCATNSEIKELNSMLRIFPAKNPSSEVVDQSSLVRIMKAAKRQKESMTGDGDGTVLDERSESVAKWVETQYSSLPDRDKVAMLKDAIEMMKAKMQNFEDNKLYFKHHLQRTDSIPGVFSDPFDAELTEYEKRLSKLRFRKGMDSYYSPAKEKTEYRKHLKQFLEQDPDELTTLEKIYNFKFKLDLLKQPDEPIMSPPPPPKSKSPPPFTTLFKSKQTKSSNDKDCMTLKISK